MTTTSRQKGPLQKVLRREFPPGERQRLTLECGHVVTRSVSARAEKSFCPECPLPDGSTRPRRKKKGTLPGGPVSEPSEPASPGRRQRIYFPAGMCEEIEAQAGRLEKSFTKMVILAWTLARAEIKKMPGRARVDKRQLRFPFVVPVK